MPIPTIYYRAIGTPEDFNRVMLSNGVVAREHGVSSWDHLRMIFRVSITPDGGVATNIDDWPHFVWGFCHGQDYLPLEDTVDNFAGWWTNDQNAERWASTPYSYNFDPVNAVTMVGAMPANIVEHGEGPAGLFIFGAETLARSAMMFDIIRLGGGSFKLLPALYRVGSADSTDADEHTFLDQAIELTPAMTGHAGPGWDRTVTIDEPGDGELDSICFGWDRVNTRIEISDVGIVRLA